MTRIWIKQGSKRLLGGAPQAVPGGSLRFFDPVGFWNKKLADNAPIVSDGNNYALKLAHQMLYTQNTTPVASYYPSGYHMLVQSSSFTPPIWTVPPGTPRVKVTWMTNNSAGPPASETLTGGLQQRFNAVPIPPGMTAADLRAPGSDQEVAFYDPATKEIWEFWHFRDTWPSAYSNLTGFNCGFGGYIQNVEIDDGIYQQGWGTRASGLSIFGGLMMMHEYLSGGFPHALVCAVPVPKATHIAPAVRHDASSNANVPGGLRTDEVPEGLICRLPPGYEPKPTAHPIVKMMAHAIRDYGLVVGDATGGTFNWYAENSKTAGTQYQGQGIATNAWTGVFSVEMRKSLRNDVDWALLQQVAYP